MPRHRHDPSKNFVGFHVGTVMYAVRIELVREIVNPLPVVELPHAPYAVRGVADYRGDVVPVVDLRERFGLEPAASRKTKWIVLDVGAPLPRAAPGKAAAPVVRSGKYAALVVDAVTDVFGAGEGGVRPAPSLGAGDDVRGVDGVTTRDGRMVFVLDARVFAPIVDAIAAELPSAPSGGP